MCEPFGKACGLAWQSVRVAWQSKAIGVTWQSVQVAWHGKACGWRGVAKRSVWRDMAKRAGGVAWQSVWRFKAKRLAWQRVTFICELYWSWRNVRFGHSIANGFGLYGMSGLDIHLRIILGFAGCHSRHSFANYIGRCGMSSVVIHLRIILIFAWQSEAIGMAKRSNWRGKE